MSSRRTANGTTTPGDKHHPNNVNPPANSSANGPLPWANTLPTIGAWFLETWKDLTWMAIMGAIGLGVYMAPPAPTRSFPVQFIGGEIVYPEFAYPMRSNIISIFAAALISFFVPLFFYIVFQFRVRSFWDFNNAVIGTLYSLINAAVFQVFLKWLIGGLRPHFLVACQPNITGVESGNGFRQIMYTRKICTGDEKEINDSLESFPSGHSTAAFAGFVFLFLYFNAKLKTWSNYHPTMFKQTLTFAPLLGATLIAGSLTIDEYHNWYDCLAGAIIGAIIAFGSFRAVYAGIWDWRINHIPLPRGGMGIVFNPTVPNGFETAVWTRKGGWGLPGGGSMSGEGMV